MSLRAAIGKRLPLLLVLLLLLLAVGFGLFMKDLFGDKKVEQKKIVQQITLLAPPPPPPPPEQEPEPEVEEEPLEDPQDEPLPDEPMDNSASPDLGVDADGSAGGDGFGLVGRKGGSGLLGGGSPYAADVQSIISENLSMNNELRHLAYQAVLKLWIDESGKLERFEIQQREGDPKVQQLLQVALAEIQRFEQPPPLEMPQPIKLRIKSQL